MLAFQNCSGVRSGDLRACSLVFQEQGDGWTVVHGPSFGSGAHVLCDLGKSLPFSGPQIPHQYTEGWTQSLPRIPRQGKAAGSGAHHGAPGCGPGPSPLRLQVSVFHLIKSAQRGNMAFELIQAESVMQSRRDGQLD